MNGLSSGQKAISWILQLVAAMILAKASYGKFTGAEMSLFIFEQLDMGAGGRYLIALIEALAALMLLTPVMPHIGALLGFGTMMGAFIAHTTVLGIDTNGDGGLLVMMLGVVVLATGVVMYIRRRDMPMIGHTC